MLILSFNTKCENVKKSAVAFIVSVLFFLSSCSSSVKKQTETIVIERQECFLKHFTHLLESDCDLSIAVDIPVQCPQPLIDSITML